MAPPRRFCSWGELQLPSASSTTSSDRQWLKVRMAPGDCLLRFGSARAWCMGVLKIDNTAPEGRGSENPCPFDFVHVKLQDHRRLRREKPDLFARCHAKRIDPKDDKFNMNPGCFQYSYRITGPETPEAPIMCKVVNDNGMRFTTVSSSGNLGHGVTMAQACYVDVSKGEGKGKGKSKRSEGRQDAGSQDKTHGTRRRWGPKQCHAHELQSDALLGA